MDEAIITPVVSPDDEHEHELEIRYDADVLTFSLDGHPVFSGDFAGNFEKVFKRSIEIWGAEE